MCGIWALLGNVDKDWTPSFMNVRPRGPDHSRVEIDTNHVLGFHRLAIMDLTALGMQPFLEVVGHGEATYYVVCNGEIYNAEEILKKYNFTVHSTSDCAVLLPLFLHLKEDVSAFNNELHGEYSCVIMKKVGSNLWFWASTDPLSVRPLFYFYDGQTVGFSSTLGGLSAFSTDVKRMPQASTLCGSVTGTTATLSGDGTPQQYRTKAVPIKYTTENADVHKVIVETLTKAVERRLISNVPVGCLLSGGLDSSLVAAIAARILKAQGKPPLRTFVCGMSGGTDIAFARRVADAIGSDHTEVMFTEADGLEAIESVMKATETYDITTIRASVGQYMVSKYIRNKTDVRVVLNGDGADECQAGYLYFYHAPTPAELHAETCRLVDQIHLYDGLRVDRCVSTHGLEARVPFLDIEFVELFKAIDGTLKQPTAERMEKYLIRKAFDVYYGEKDPILPHDVLWRKKEAFSDGISSKEKSWYVSVREFIEGKSTSPFTPEKFKHVPPPSREAQYYREKFDQTYNGNSQVIPAYWLPRWVETNGEPSARVLKVYHETK